ncbi:MULTISPECIES: Nif3-like dinuclear metal center hexameric protein [unclassified Streptococcus]|uniref:Nif3-like dinuclear metal center hexameric protein n=1 Tax=unclassified Streptococcus TaxID=2608887 RepID=UPI0018AA8534|nr:MULTISPECIES: Nif3-like dinuclear metal center hexameric protein [unclassified Streptococcus]MBF8969439.1 Nif3-like dinuclear metal center hexameric protein [Streptococcus sp. NLN76]MBG9366585.1 Nif3-like dinuclear metal center hexameric protein [Streptococcus sp. NLN64]MBJ6745301.1 Nif3-like dinuclear metal center hexameric protein [Streptococcus sp. 121]
MKVRDVLKRYEAFCPPELSLEGDQVGLQIGSLDKDVKRVMVTLDIREQTVQEAIANQVDLLIVKHAPIFRPIKNLVYDQGMNGIYVDLIKADIAVYVSHTNIDVVEGGLNDWFCDLLGITHVEPLHETLPGQGIGRIGDIESMEFQDLALKVKETFHLDSVRLVEYPGYIDTPVTRVAICGGSGQSFAKDALEKGADVLITGDIYYHNAQDFLSQGLRAIDPGHYIEILFVHGVSALFERWSQEEGWELDILGSRVSTNPFYHL